MGVLVFAEHDGAAVTEATRRAVSAASALGAPVDAVVAGGDEYWGAPESVVVRYLAPKPLLFDFGKLALVDFCVHSC